MDLANMRENGVRSRSLRIPSAWSFHDAKDRAHKPENDRTG
jgi:hypothetical protein